MRAGYCDLDEAIETHAHLAQATAQDFHPVVEARVQGGNMIGIDVFIAGLLLYGLVLLGFAAMTEPTIPNRLETPDMHDAPISVTRRGMSTTTTRKGMTQQLDAR